MSSSEQDPQLEQRLVALEEWMMHTDRLVSNLNDVVCSLQVRIDEQTRQTDLLRQTLAQVENREVEERSLEDERPPHY